MTADTSHATSFEVDLDEEPEPTREPVYVDITTRDHERRPVIPAALRGTSNMKAAARRAAGRAGHTLAYHVVRLPRYVVLAAFWAVVGAGRLAGRQVRWWWVAEQSTLRQEAATRNDPATWLALHREARATRLWRATVLGAELLGIIVVGLVLALVAPGWVQVLTMAVTVPLLARVGRPVGRPIMSAAVVTPRFRKLTADIVLRAYYAARLGDPVKPGQEITFGSTMARDGNGSRVVVDLPYGRGLDDAVKARGAIASGLDVAVSQVFITRDPTSHRRHVLWVADVDPLAVPAGRTPLLRLRQTDIWEPAPFGLDERGGKVLLGLLWNSVMIGAIPRQGKTFSARALALYAALDPYVQLTVFDGKGSPDWRKFALVADRCGFGLAMTRDGDPVELFLEALREIKADVQDRYQRLSELPASVCPEGKLTREIARDPKYRMPVRLVVIDEFQEYFDLGEPSKEIASLLVFLVKVAPAAGVIVLGATQKPSGIGTGAVAQQFTAFRDNFAVRFSLRTGSWQVSDLVLGSGAYSEGYDSSTLLPAYKGVGILRGATDATPTVRTYLADQEDAERILTAARALRERAGTLTGEAAGESAARQARDVLADVVKVWSHVGRPGVQWPALAELLAAHLPEGYAGATPESVSALLRAEGVTSVDVKASGVVLKGCKLADVETAIHRRQLTG
ncbi:cell division protein FtsK [Dactylosporangium sp. NPDC006015]|uniref:cell division protein FtsK n=1 Tax=Dactylosporangium sp. NPDC006015 TaxID=3154576 RepID=UPI0033A60505